MTTDVKSTVVEILNRYSEQQFAKASLDDSLTLEHLKLDSLDILELIYELEERFQLELDADEFRQIESVGQLVQVFEVKLRCAA